MDKQTKFALILLIAVGLLGCDNLKCRPDVHPDKKNDLAGWFYGFRCGGEF